MISGVPCIYFLVNPIAFHKKVVGSATKTVQVLATKHWRKLQIENRFNPIRFLMLNELKLSLLHIIHMHTSMSQFEKNNWLHHVYNMANVNL